MNLSIWQLGGCLVLMTGANYAFGRLAGNLSQIYIALKQLIALSPISSRESTWPGEADWLSDDEDDILNKPIVVDSKQTSMPIPTTKHLSLVLDSAILIR